jgi:hypothetical protein
MGVDTMGEKTDPAELAASTAQGWAYALNTVARPAPEHLEAAQEALTALLRADPPASVFGGAGRWEGVRDTLSGALTAARLRVDGGRTVLAEPEVTVAQLVSALGQLHAAGLIGDPQRPDPALAQAMRADGAAGRIAELEEQLEEDAELASAEMAELRGQLARAVELRDRFERERDATQRDAAAAHRGHSAAVDAARYQERRAHWLAVLAAFGMNPPGFAEMETTELEREARAQLGNAVRAGHDLRVITEELTRAGRRLQAALRDEPGALPPEDAPARLAVAVVGVADACVRERAAAVARQRELEDQILELGQADGQLSENERAATLVERTKLRRRVAELEAVVQLRANDSDEVLGRQLEHVRAERDGVMRSRDAQAEVLRELRLERGNVEKRLAESQGRAERLKAQLAAYQEADQR